MKANLTDFGSIIKKDLGGLLSRCSLIDDPLSSAAESVADISTQAGKISAVAQDVASSASSNVPQTVGAIVDDAGALSKNISGSIAKVVSGIPEFYMIRLWSYCTGTSNDTGSIVVNCITPSSSFWFNFTEVLGLESLETSLVGKIFPSQYEGVMKVYRTASKGIIAFYIMAVITSVLTTVLGLTATLSQWGSSFTTIFAIASAAFNLAGSALATGVYASLIGILKALVIDRVFVDRLPILAPEQLLLFRELKVSQLQSYAAPFVSDSLHGISFSEQEARLEVFDLFGL
ncbi:hypothetical protein KXV22_006014 [Aspergillus fumigatus]|nr:hypothetical protein KXX38_006352 [Aspergillus fumigatus]KAH1335562.1 hypothetical protein KXX14_008362 [Aspergillus fumigatus]KAH1490701.1 hypothetical protein KXX06_003048 [Aspergillus fumigatus]KAH1656521.1 hypothetical protein KXX65_007196 [Aspergillus fumigatus]KAH1742236.1 hypothetical protein KXX09_001257 [Aspergillus fumigatus]